MDKSILYQSLLSKYCKQIVHMRQQYHLSSSNLGIVLGAGASKDIGLPNWKELVQCIAQHDQIEYGGEVEHLGRCELNTFVAVN